MKPIRKQIADCLRHVEDPELSINIVDLGLVYGLRFEKGALTITLTMTTPACPLSDALRRQIRCVMDRVDGIETVSIETVWEPAWSPAMMAPEVRADRFQRPAW
jgi:metal-sulfur cluster biosynthetic enzyme